MMPSLGFLVNPIAGMGGSVGLKGTDGMLKEALQRGATPVAPGRARTFIEALTTPFSFTTCGAPMGSDILGQCGRGAEVVYTPGKPTASDDTWRAVQQMQDVDLIVFVGGDGTAQDILEAVDPDVPVLGVPAGVKMYSAVFAQTPRHAARVADAFAGGLPLEEREVVDIDEQRFRRDELAVSVKGYLLTPVHEAVQSSKGFGIGGEAAKQAIARHVAATMDDDVTYVVGGGSTTMALKQEVGVDGSLLGVDVIRNRRIVIRDATETEILEALTSRSAVIVSPLGGHGFLFGRGNEQISPAVLRRVGPDNVIVISAAEKLSGLQSLKVDTGDAALDEELQGYIRVVTGAGECRLMRVE
ncbi:MAG: ATP-NAD kinase family protein [Thermoplasmatota archaeon]